MDVLVVVFLLGAFICMAIVIGRILSALDRCAYTLQQIADEIERANELRQLDVDYQNGRAHGQTMTPPVQTLR